jgi:class 3 adenylate cyclase
MPPVRRLAAILAADVAGYSHLMGLDEERTHERLQAYLRELVNPKIKEHRGRIVKNTGDGFLAEFASVVDAVRCTTEIQRGDVLEWQYRERRLVGQWQRRTGASRLGQWNAVGTGRAMFLTLLLTQILKAELDLSRT